MKIIIKAVFLLLIIFSADLFAAGGSYSTSGVGTYNQSLWWLDFSTYKDSTASSRGQGFVFYLPNTAGTIRTTVTNDTNNQNGSIMQVVAEPAWAAGGAFGNGAYNGIANKPIFYWLNQPDTPGIITLNNIVVKDHGGHNRNFVMYFADGENTSPGESIEYISDVNLSLIDTVNYYPKYNGGVPSLNFFAGNDVLETDSTGANYNASIILGASNPTVMSAAMSNNEGVLFAIAMPKITFNLVIGGRVQATDQFVLSMGYTGPNYTLKTLTSSGTATGLGTGVLPVIGTNNLSLSVAMKTGSPSPLSSYIGTISCVNNGPGAGGYGTATVLPSGYGTSFSVIPQAGDDLVCTLNLSPNIVDHYEVVFNPANSGLTCMPIPLTLRACSSTVSPCTSSANQVASTVTFSLSSTLGNFSNGLSLMSWSFIGQTTDKLSSTMAGVASLSSGSPTPVYCFSGSTLLGACSATFNDMGFIFNWLSNPVVTGNGVVIAGNTSSVVEVSAVQKSNTTNACVGFTPSTNPVVSMSYADPTSGTRSLVLTPTNSVGAGSTSYTITPAGGMVPFVWDANGNSYMTLSYKDAGEIGINISLSSPVATGQTMLISKPYELLPYNAVTDVVCADGTVLSSAANQKFCQSGNGFDLKIRGYASDLTVLPNFGLESTVTQFVVSGNILSPVSGQSGNLTNIDLGTTNPLASGVLVNNVHTCSGSDCYSLNNFSWDNVGQIGMSINLASSYFGSGLIGMAPLLPVGRFYPYGFSPAVGSIVNRSDLSCAPASVFTYMNEPFQGLIQLSAVNMAGNVTSNYGLVGGLDPTVGSSWGLTSSSGATNLSSRINFNSETGAWSSGVLNATLNLDFTRLATPDGPWNVLVNISPVDPDGVSLLGTNPYSLGTSNFYFGIFKIYNASGSDLLPLPIKIATQYYNQYGFTINSLDNCSTFASGNFSDYGFTQNILASNISFVYPGALIAGVQTLLMNKPSGGTPPYNGKFNITYNLSGSQAYLQGLWNGVGGYVQNPVGEVILSRSLWNGKTIFFKELF